MDAYPSSSYVINAEDQIVEANNGFWSFAHANGWTPEPDTVLGRSLWNFFADSGVTLFYRHLLSVIRQDANPICFSLRCDSPDYERHMTMALAPVHDGAIRFVAELDLEVAWSFASRPLEETVRLLCPDCFCTEINGVWRPVTQGLLTQKITIGVERIDLVTCPGCQSIAVGTSG